MEASLLLSNLLPRLLGMIVLIVGIVLALTWWQRHPRASLWALLACGLLLLSSVAGLVWYSMLPTMQANRGLSAMQMGWLYSISAFVFAAVNAAGLAMLLVAVFSGRAPARPPGWQPAKPVPAVPPGLDRDNPTAIRP
jgi:hypothetical protein